MQVTNEKEIGAPLQGKIAEIKVEEGQEVDKEDVLFVVEAMKMETSVSAPHSGKIKNVQLKAGELVEQDDLIIEME